MKFLLAIYVNFEPFAYWHTRNCTSLKCTIREFLTFTHEIITQSGGEHKPYPGSSLRALESLSAMLFLSRKPLPRLSPLSLEVYTKGVIKETRHVSDAIIPSLGNRGRQGNSASVYLNLSYLCHSMVTLRTAWAV